MNAWMLAAAAIMLTLVPCAWMCLRGTAERRLVGLEMTSVQITIAMVLLCMAFDRQILVDLPLALSIMSFGGGLVYARFLEKHL
jgi:multicomponent Na+:H+ antiporter subunit F